MEKTKIFVDGNCVLCDMEMSHYKRLAPELFELVDISDDRFDAGDFGLNTTDVNKRLHVLTPNREVKVGVDAVAHLWEQLPGYQVAAKIIDLPVMNTFVKIGYEGFSVIRPWLPKKNKIFNLFSKFTRD